jgi:hypothetical protein
VLVVDDAVVEVDEDVELLPPHPTAPTESTKATAAIPIRRLTMVSSFHWGQGVGRAEGPSCGVRPSPGFEFRQVPQEAPGAAPVCHPPRASPSDERPYSPHQLPSTLIHGDRVGNG